MKNFIQLGDSLDLVAPTGGVVSGAAYLIGASILAVAAASKAVGETFAGFVEGCFELPKLSTDNMAVGAKVNWNDTNAELQLATSDLDGCATVIEAAGASTTTVKVKLTPV